MKQCNTDTHPQSDPCTVCKRIWRGCTPVFVIASLAAVILVALCFLPLGPMRHMIPLASAHALPVHSDPAPHAVLRSPPSQVTIWFDDALIPTTSHITVENAQGQRVDRNDSQVRSSNRREMSVRLSSLSGGTYTVLWVAQSADDGHVTQGSFTFRVIGASGSLGLVPPAHQGRNGSGKTILDGPVIIQAIATWLALLFTTFWVGGLIWETWVLSPDTTRDSDLTVAASAASRRFRQLTPAALWAILAANIALILALEAEYAGGWSALFQLAAWRTVLFGSFFGLFWRMREAVVLSALVLTHLAARRGWSRRREHTASMATPPPASLAEIPDWWHGVVMVWRSLPRLPGQLAAGWHACSWLGRAEIALGATLLLAFALSGHATAVPPQELGYAVSVDLLHLAGNATWVGGLLYIGFVLTPALGRLSARSHARVLALGLPRFSALAIVCALLLAATGSLNTTIHLTSILQFVTTLYGQVLATKIEFFLLMVLISAYHAFVLRPRLTQALRQYATILAPRHEPIPLTERAGLAARGGQKGSLSASRSFEGTHTRGDQEAEELSEPARILAARMDLWLRREAMLGAAVLVCVALLSVFAGTLTPQ